MEEGQPSLTAIGSAMFRAAHLLLDDDPKILQDGLALGLSGFANETAFRAVLEARHEEVAQRFTPEYAQFHFRSLRTTIMARSRYVEDELATALEHGVTQYVLLGAGLDSFAYRRRDLSGVLRVFEVDHPATQQWKRARLRELAVALPDTLTFVPVDFERQTVREALSAGGYRVEEPAFFSWLGVTQYLTAEATLKTLQEIAALAPGSEIVFEYTVPEATLAREERQYVACCKARAAERGEPWVGFFEPTRLVTLVKEVGFTEVTDLSPQELNHRYFPDRADGLRTPQAQHLVKARVGKGP
jgi:methyltransferase (TIGR00027 family)